jgi:DNA-directed RNA polymerase subunit RPC12/RpoP
MAERQTDYTIMEGYELPSKGKIYSKAVNPHVELRSMTARDEMKRLSPSNTPLKTLADIIEGCCVEQPGIHVYDMSLGDYEFLLHKLRIVTYGEDYKVGLRCPDCGEKIETIAKLGQLDVKEYDEDSANALRMFSLPKSGRTVSLNFISPRMVEEMEAKVKDMKRRYKTATIDFDTFVRLLFNIDTVDGEKKSETEMENFITSLPAMDLQKILNNIEKLNQLVGLDNTLYLTCPSCGGEISTFFRFGPEFFRPTNI